MNGDDVSRTVNWAFEQPDPLEALRALDRSASTDAEASPDREDSQEVLAIGILCSLDTRVYHLNFSKRTYRLMRDPAMAECRIRVEYRTSAIQICC